MRGPQPVGLGTARGNSASDQFFEPEARHEMEVEATASGHELSFQFLAAPAVSVPELPPRAVFQALTHFPAPDSNPSGSVERVSSETPTEASTDAPKNVYENFFSDL